MSISKEERGMILRKEWDQFLPSIVQGLLNCSSPFARSPPGFSLYKLAYRDIAKGWIKKASERLKNLGVIHDGWARQMQ